MDVNSFLKRIIVIGLVSALPVLVNVASAHGGGHGSGGSSGGGHGSGGSSGSGASSGGGHGSGGSSSSGASSGGHSASVSSAGHSSSVANSGQSSSVSKGGHSGGDPSTAPGTAVGGHSMSNGSLHASTVRSRPESISHFRHFSTGWGHGDWQAGEENVDWTRHHGRRLFGFIWY
jgi:hypothetical protein